MEPVGCASLPYTVVVAEREQRSPIADAGRTRARTRPLCQASGMDDKTILSRISELVDEEHRLRADLEEQ